MRKLALLLLIGILTACTGAGSKALRSESESSVAQKIVQGKTTKSEVKNMFGSPLKTSFTDNGLEVWNYEFTKVSGDAVNYIPIVNLFGSSASGTKKELVVLFDENNVVKRYSMSESDVTQRTGIFNQ